MFNCPTYDLKKRKLLPAVEYEKEVFVYNLVPVAKKLIDAEGVEYNGIEYEAQFIKKYNLQEYIDSFSDDVGLKNILKKLSLTGDTSLLNQTGREPLCPNGGLEPIQDYSNVPSSKAEAFNMVAAGVAAYDNLPEDIKGKMSMAQFANEFGQAQFDAYVQSVVAKYAANGGDQK